MTMDALTWLWYALAMLLLLAGVVGTVVPVIPGLTFMAAGVIVAALASDFTVIGWGTVAVAIVLAALGFVLDILGQALGAKKAQASQPAIWLSVIGSIVGLVFSFVGMFIGAFVGAVVGQLYSTKNVEHATRVGVATWIGMVVTMALKLVLGLSLLIWTLWQIGSHVALHAQAV